MYEDYNKDLHCLLILVKTSKEISNDSFEKNTIFKTMLFHLTFLHRMVMDPFISNVTFSIPPEKISMYRYLTSAKMGKTLTNEITRQGNI